MALHGEVKINGDILGTWVATRMDESPTFQDEKEYRVQWQPVERVVQYEGRLTHRYSEGAASLASKVLAWAAEQERAADD